MNTFKVGNLTVAVVACALPSRCDPATLAIRDSGSDKELTALLGQLRKFMAGHPLENRMTQIEADPARVPDIERLLRAAAGGKS